MEGKNYDKKRKIRKFIEGVRIWKTCIYNQWESKKYKVCVYTYYNKIESVQLSKVWFGKLTNYENYLEEVKELLKQLNNIQ